MTLMKCVAIRLAHPCSRKTCGSVHSPDQFAGLPVRSGSESGTGQPAAPTRARSRRHRCGPPWPLPSAALQAAVRRGEGISEPVLASGNALSIADILDPDFARRHGEEPGWNAASSALRSASKGASPVSSTSQWQGCCSFDDAALCQLQLVALFLRRTLQCITCGTCSVPASPGWGCCGKRKRRGRQPEGSLTTIPTRSRRSCTLVFSRAAPGRFAPAQILSMASELIGQRNRHVQQEHRAVPAFACRQSPTKSCPVGHHATPTMLGGRKDRMCSV